MIIKNFDEFVNESVADGLKSSSRDIRSKTMNSALRMIKDSMERLGPVGKVIAEWALDPKNKNNVMALAPMLLSVDRTFASEWESYQSEPGPKETIYAELSRLAKTGKYAFYLYDIRKDEIDVTNDLKNGNIQDDYTWNYPVVRIFAKNPAAQKAIDNVKNMGDVYWFIVNSWNDRNEEVKNGNMQPFTDWQADFKELKSPDQNFIFCQFNVDMSSSPLKLILSALNKL